MASYDPFDQRVCIRVVYDGVGGAGKTTNLRMIRELLATQRAIEFYSPGDVGGRTLYFDWLEIPSGSVCGLPLTSQLISVPGQPAFASRRRDLLASADVVVFVADSSPAGVAEGRRALALLDEASAGRRVPLVVQANKQDAPGALVGPAVAAGLGRESAPVIEAVGADGVGVIDTFLGAVRLAVRAIQAEADAGTLRLEVKRAETAAALLARARRCAIDPELASEVLLEEALTEMLLHT